MNQYISDLFDSVEYNPLKVDVLDSVSVERVKVLTMSRITDNTIIVPRAYQRHKPILVAIIAAVLLTVLCGAAYATNLFSVRELLLDKFMSSQVELGNDDLELLEGIGAVENQSITSNGTTMTVTAAVYDGSNYYLALKVTAPDGTTLDSGDSCWQIWGDMPDESLSIALRSGYELDRGVDVMFNDDTPGDNEITLVIEIVSSKGAFGNGESKTLIIRGLWLQSPDNVYTKILDGEWSFDIEALGINGSIPGTDTGAEETGGYDPTSGEPLPLGD
jgi:hypothetical protein